LFSVSDPNLVDSTQATDLAGGCVGQLTDTGV